MNIDSTNRGPEQPSELTAGDAGDILVLLTDGLTEVFDKSGREVESVRCRDVLGRAASQRLPELSATIRQAALGFGRRTTIGPCCWFGAFRNLPR